MQKSRLWAAAILAAVLGLGLLAPTTSSAASSPASASVAVLMKSYDASSGRIGGGWWTGAVALSTVMTYRQATGDSQYDYAITGAWDRNKSGNFENEYLDDTGWWALVWIQAYDITGNAAYLQMAQTDANYIHGYWDTQCGGGVYWSTMKQYKASIANELFLAVTAGLHNRLPGDTTYLGWANAEWSWFSGSGLLSANLVKDGLYLPGCTFNGANLSYNQGVVLQGLSELAKARGNTGPLTTARSIATAATHRFIKNGVLYDGCEPNCTGDFQSFKGIFVRYLRAFARTVNTTGYDGFMTATANSILTNDTNDTGQQGNSFLGPFAEWTYNTQATAAEALVAALAPSAQPAKPPTHQAPKSSPNGSPPSVSASASSSSGASTPPLAVGTAVPVDDSETVASTASTATAARAGSLALLAIVSALSAGLVICGAGLLLRWRRLR